jgi:ribosome-associated toxin RatA of RatAB toxin-antitoxin module
MHTESRILIRARPETVYGLAADVARWPEILPHYRWVRVLEERGAERLVDMGAHRDGFPVRWWALQRCFPDEPRITFRHVRGITRGMWVEWRFEPRPDGAWVSIEHELWLGWPLVGGPVADRVIGPVFVDDIAGKTLRRMKQLAERLDAGRIDAR